MRQKKLIDDGVRQGSMLERLLFNTVPTDLFLECEDDDIDSYTDETTAFSCKRYVFCNYSTSKSLHDMWYETIMRMLILENSCSVKLQYSNSSFF